jgi:hypothetical protein
MKIDPYLTETLMRDLVAHSRSAAAFLVYLQLYSLTHGSGRNSLAMSHGVLAELTGISKRSVQTANRPPYRPPPAPKPQGPAHVRARL